MKKRITIIFLSITIIIAQISSPVFASNLINKNQLLNNMATDWIKLLEEIEDTYYGKILNDTIETVIISDESVGTVEEVTCKVALSEISALLANEEERSKFKGLLEELGEEVIDNMLSCIINDEEDTVSDMIKEYATLAVGVAYSQTAEKYFSKVNMSNTEEENEYFMMKGAEYGIFACELVVHKIDFAKKNSGLTINALMKKIMDIAIDVAPTNVEILNTTLNYTLDFGGAVLESQYKIDDLNYYMENRNVIDNEYDDFLKVIANQYGLYEVSFDNFNVCLERYNGYLLSEDDYKSVNVPKKYLGICAVVKIGDEAFKYCEIESIDVPSSIKEIGWEAFWGNNKLTEVSLKEGIEILGHDVFVMCPIEEFTFPSTLKEIGGRVLWENNKLKNVNYNVVDNDGSRTEAIIQECKSDFKVNFADNVTRIPDRFIYDCGITEIKIPSTVEEIGMYAFADTKLVNVEIPQNVESLKYGAFYENNDLKNIIFYNSVCEIDEDIVTLPESTVIYGYKNSTAEVYANNHDRKFHIIDCVHNYVVIEKLESTCDTEGRITYECGKCKGRYFIPIQFKNCTYNVATCTEPKKCKICKRTSGSALGHSYSSTYTTDKKATSSANGSKSKHCTRSGCSAKTSVTTIPKISSVSVSTSKYTYDGYNHLPAITVKDAKGNTLKKGTDYTTSYPSSRWNVGRYKITVTMKGNYSGTFYRYYTIVPKAATNTKANLYGYDDVKVTWTKAKGASGYFVYYKKSASSSYTYYSRTTGTSMKFANLTDGVKYNFKVVPYYYSSDNDTRYTSLQSSVASVYTLKQLSAPTVTRNGTKVKVEWTNINGESGYQISRSTSKTGTNIVLTNTYTTGTYNNVSATKGTGYYYKVRAYKTVNGTKIYAPWSSVKYFKR